MINLHLIIMIYTIKNYLKQNLKQNWCYKNSLYKVISAFTLAEVLIVLLIIGVVASMVIPGIIADTQQAELKNGFKKAYNTASQAWKLVVAENPNTYTGRGGWICTWPTGETQDYNIADNRTNAFKAKLNVVKTCINQDGCWPKNYEFPGHGSLLGWEYGTVHGPQVFSWITSDGMCWSNPYYNWDDIHIIVDTNCNKGPNLIGQDIFSFLLGADGAVYFAIDDKSTNGKPVSSGHACPCMSSPTTINSRNVDFKSWLVN